MSEPADESTTPKNPVPRSLRMGTFLLSVLLTFLFVWLLGFVLGDIGDIDGPDYQQILETHVDQDLRDSADRLQGQINAIETQVKRQEQRQGDLKRSMDNARDTMKQMMDLQRLSLEKQSTPTPEERTALATAQQRFLEAQEKFQEANTEIETSNETRFELSQELETTKGQIKKQEEPARDDYEEQRRKHQFKLASLKLAFIVPLFALLTWLFFRYRDSPYRPILVAALVATFWKIGVVMFDYFPRDFFKYIAIVAAIIIVLVFLVWMLRKAIKPNRELLLNRYREAYRAHTCPICTYPIARGPLRFAHWTRKGPQIPTGATQESSSADDSPYVCPSCGTGLYEECSKCGASRHSLLPFCEHCGEASEKSGDQSSVGSTDS